jgi:hypothetical protein
MTWLLVVRMAFLLASGYGFLRVGSGPQQGEHRGVVFRLMIYELRHP